MAAPIVVQKTLFVVPAVFALLGWLAWRLRHVHALRTQARWIAGLALWQFVTGLSNVVLGWPLVAAVSHTGGAAALVVVLTWALVASRSATAEARDAPSSWPQADDLTCLATLQLS